MHQHEGEECCDCYAIQPLKLKIIEPNQRVGHAVKLQKSLYETVTQLSTRGCYCVQFFLGGKINYQCRTLDPRDKEKTLRHCEVNDKTFYLHCPYVANLAKPEPEPWNKSKDTVQKYINQIQNMPAAAVLHFGNGSTGGNVHRIIEAINDMNIHHGTHQRTPKPLLIENAAGKGKDLGTTWDEFRHLFEGIDRSTVGLCLDTQHIFGAGMNTMQSYEAVTQLFDQCEEILPGSLQLIHLNDSQVPWQGRNDVHASLRQGHIWNASDEGLRALLARCQEHNIDVILETPDIVWDFSLIRDTYF